MNRTGECAAAGRQRMHTQISRPADYRAALYIRLSRDDDNEKESESVSNQRSLLYDFAGRQGLEVADTYIDDGYSGTNFDRPAFLRMLGDIDSGKVNMVITKDMSRLGRDYILTGHYLERYFPERNVRYISLLDGVDTGLDISANDITPFKAIMNDMYARDISRKITSVKRHKQEKGLFIGGKAPYGYKLSAERKNALETDGEAAEIVRKIFGLAIEGMSCRKIAGFLNENKIPTPSAYAGISVRGNKPYSGLWSAERVTATLKNQVYTGDMVQGKMRKISYKLKKSRRLPPEDWIIVKDTHEALVSRADFEKVQGMIMSRSRTRERTYDFLLKGLLYCRECGYPLAVINRELSGGRQRLYTVCRTYQRFTSLGKCTCHCARLESVTEAVLEKLREICLLHLDYEKCEQIISIEAEAAKTENPCEKTLARLADREATLTAYLDQAYGDRLSGCLEEEDFKRIYQKIREELLSCKEQIRLLEPVGFPKAPGTEPARQIIDRFIRSLDSNRELLISLVEKVDLSEDKRLRIFFKTAAE